MTAGSTRITDEHRPRRHREDQKMNPDAKFIGNAGARRKRRSVQSISRAIPRCARRMMTSHRRILKPPAVETAAPPMIAVSKHDRQAAAPHQSGKSVGRQDRGGVEELRQRSNRHRRRPASSQKKKRDERGNNGKYKRRFSISRTRSFAPRTRRRDQQRNSHPLKHHQSETKRQPTRATSRRPHRPRPLAMKSATDATPDSAITTASSVGAPASREIPQRR